jgi:hypothetical protein
MKIKSIKNSFQKNEDWVQKNKKLIPVRLFVTEDKKGKAVTNIF